MVVLAPASVTAPLWPELADWLVARHRVIVPALGDEHVSVAAQSAGFLEGLGTRGVSVVAVGSCCVAALELALRDTDQIARVALIPDGPADESACCGLLAAAERSPPVGLLIAPRELPAGEALRLFSSFLAGQAVDGIGSERTTP